MQPIRVDINYGIEYEWDFQAPIHHPRKNRVSSWLDHAVQEKNYVYCSFDSFPHHMSYNMWDKPIRDLTEDECKDKCIYYVDHSQLEHKAEVVMMDIVNLYCSSKWLLKSYMNNIFDYEWWKEVIAKYLSIVFDDIEEAERFILRNNGQYLVDNWLNWSFAVPDGMTEERVKEIQQQMKTIYEKTWLVPPLSTEVRIHDSVKVISKNTTVKKQVKDIL